MNDLKFASRQLLKNPGFTAVAVLTLALGIGANTTALGHPGSGIVVDCRGQVYFVDTGQGVWKIDERGRVSAHEGPAYHFMAIDPDARLARTRWSAFHEPSTDIRRVGADPTLVVSSDFPLTTGRDESLYFPDLEEDDLLRVFQINPWSPTGVAVSGDAVFVLEYLHTASGNRREWTPRVRKLSRDGTATVLASVERVGGGSSREPAPKANSFVGAKGGDEIEVGGVRLCWCPPGRFRMGSPSGEIGRRADEAQVGVTLSKGFWTGKFEVTQGQWKGVMGAIPGKLIAGEGDDFPVYWISFIEAEEYCRRLTARARALDELPTGWEFRLPTEAQWEYACRAGTTTAFAFGESLTITQANIGKPYNGKPDGTPGAAAVTVGNYAANAWGLHDMHGNEFEWCRDWYHPRLPGGTDPDLRDAQGTPNRDGTYSRVRRGGAWMDDARFCRSALRLRYEPPRRADHIGFRVVVVQPRHETVIPP